MKRVMIGLLVLATGSFALAQEPAPTPPAATTSAVSRQLGLHAFPAKNQAAAEQQKDERDCYQWAVQDSGFDPLAAGEPQPAPTPPSQNGGPSTAKGAATGAVGGAAAGAIIGAIAGDTGKGAGIGAVTGLLGGVAVAKHKQKEARNEAEQEHADREALAKAEAQRKLDGFKKGYSACLEAKGYVVK